MSEAAVSDGAYQQYAFYKCFLLYRGKKRNIKFIILLIYKATVPQY